MDEAKVRRAGLHERLRLSGCPENGTVRVRRVGAIALPQAGGMFQCTWNIATLDESFHFVCNAAPSGSTLLPALRDATTRRKRPRSSSGVILSGNGYLAGRVEFGGSLL